MSSYQVGVCPITETGLIVLVTNKSGDFWIFPKGKVEKNKEDVVVAAEEAWEEAGVIGTITQSPERIPVKSKKAGELLLYIMHVSEVFIDFPEAKKRKRKLVTVEEAKELLQEDLQSALLGIIEKQIIPVAVC